MKRNVRNTLVALTVAAAALAAVTCGDDDPVDPLPSGPVTLDQLIDACIATSACGVKQWPKVSSCLDAYYTLAAPQGITPVYDKIFHCVNAAKGDCSAVFECYGSSRYAGSCDTTYKATCEGDSAYSCDAIARKVFIYDCTAAKLVCRTKQQSSVDAYCSRGSCTPGQYKTACEGNVLLSCVDGVIQADDCAARGLICGKSLAGGTVCLGEDKQTCNTDPTKPPYQVNCKGSVAYSCENYQIHKEDCSKRPYKTSCTSGQCAFASSECTESDFNRCTGEKLQYCKEGKWVTLDCAAAGLGNCQSAVNGANCSAKQW